MSADVQQVSPDPDRGAGEPGSRISLREHQKVAIVELRRALKAGHKRVVLMAPCSFGKTRVAAFMALAGASRGRRTMFVCDRIELIDQASRAFDELGIPHGVIQSKHPRHMPSALVQIASVQTLAAKRKQAERNAARLAEGKRVSIAQEQHAVMPVAETIITDEVHTLHEEHARLIAENPEAVFIGLTATPWTKGLGKLYQHVVQPVTVSELIEQSFLVEPAVYGPDIDLSKVRVVAGEYREDDLDAAVNTKEIVGDIVTHWLKICSGQPTICFAVSVAHSKHIVEAFKRVGVAAEHIDGYMTSPDGKKQRRETIDRFRSGETTLLSSVDILSKGFDYPGATCAIMARPTKSKMLFIQQIGRVMRIADGKSSCVVLDHAGNHLRLGFVTDPYETELDDGKKGKSSEKKKERIEPLPKTCPKCMHIKPAAVHKCPACGFEPIPPANVNVIAGKLTLLKKSAKHQIKPLEERFGTKQEVYSMLCEVRSSRGYSAGYVSHKFKEIFGVWPKGLREAPIAVSAALHGWLQSRAIQYAKSRPEQRHA